MARFLAIPVGQGDAFYLERDDVSVLVDGGRSQSGFPAMFQAVTRTDGVNFVICTHNDADHANGVLGFLKAGLRCDAVWLPGRWLAVLPHVLKPFGEVLVELTNDVVEIKGEPNIGQPHSELSPIEVYAESHARPVDEVAKTNEGPSVGEDGWPESYIQILEQAEPWEVAPWMPWWWLLDDLPEVLGPFARPLGLGSARLLWSAIDAASRIRAIAIEAFHRGIPVRWFEFNPATPSGGVTALEPVNARAIARAHRLVGSLLDYLALTVSNRESLVFWSPPTKQHPGVLFTADSDLANVRLPSYLHGALATAPHHGSEANANAYAAVAAVANNVYHSITWIRSDGRYRTRPGSTYLGLSSRRLCTLCRLSVGNTTTKQAVHLFSRAGSWTRHKATARCSCR